MKTIDVSTEHGGILLLTFRGVVTNANEVASLKNDIRLVSQSIKELQGRLDKKIKVMVDISEFQADYISEGVEALVELARQDRGLVEKTAVFGGTLAVRTIGETIASLSGRGNIRFFENKAEALAWVQ